MRNRLVFEYPRPKGKGKLWRMGAVGTKKFPLKSRLTVGMLVNRGVLVEVIQKGCTVKISN